MTNKEYTIDLRPDYLFSFHPDNKKNINKFGFRDKEFHYKKTSKKRVCFLGDSFVMGLNVKPEETMPKVLERFLGNDFEVLNMGVSGFGPDQSLIFFEKTGIKFKPDTLLLNIFPDNDFSDIVKNGIFKLSDKNEIRLNPKNIIKTEVFPSKFFTVDQILFLINKNTLVEALDPILFFDKYDYLQETSSELSFFKYSLMRNIIKKFNDLTKKNNIDLLVIITPSYPVICDESTSKGQPNLNNVFLMKKICRELGVNFLDLTPYFFQFSSKCSLYDLSDYHLSALGNLYSAQNIKNYMKNSGFLKLSN